MDLSVIIVSWNVRELLRSCLLSLPTATARLSTEVIVIDNGSTDGCAGMVDRDFPEVQLIRNSENAGFARANNQGLALAAARYVVLLNADTEAQPGSLAEMVRFMDAHPRAGAASPRLVTPSGVPQPYAFGEDPTPVYLLRRALAQRKRGFLHDWGVSAPIQAGWVSGACLMARRAAFVQVGGLDEHIFMYFEDNDWCRRMRLRGWEIWYNPTGEVKHVGGASLGQNPGARAAYYDSLIYFYRKHYGRFAAAAIKGLVWAARSTP